MHEITNQPGAPHDRDDRLQGEVFAALSDWELEFETTGSELAYVVVRTLLKHLERNQGLACMIEFEEKLAEIISEEAAGLRKILNDDFLQRRH